jgi:predicted short-subunit dehydrogenase-like oxidoreductase (DUF2520 family)
MNVTFIGSGNLAWHLAPALDNTDYHVREVYSLNASHAEALAERLYDARVHATLDFSASLSRIFIIAVSDDAIADVVQDIVLPHDAVLLHTSGSQPVNLLAYAAIPRIGVFYPLQTFSKNRKVDFQEIPLFIESEDRETEKILLKMARAVGKRVHAISSVDRRSLHLAAVFASNFTNHMLALSQDVLKASKLDFEWMKPLIAETINKSLTLGPESAQTGPAKRGDLEVLDVHLAMLQDNSALAEIYRIISQNIVDRYDE